MCGVAGIVSVDGRPRASAAVLAAMSRRLSHRGPDDAGHVLLGPGDGDARSFLEPSSMPDAASVAGLAHRRLSILDLSSAGHQPCADPEGRVWLTYNGEVYNYVELRAELTALGHVFASTSDTEVVLKSYLQWGTECFRRFNGMWALALYDRREGTLILSRDRFGKKPLYMTDVPGAILFASEIKALFAHPEVRARPNWRKVAAYAGGHYRYVDNDAESFFAGIEHVPPASFLTMDARGRRTVTTYWRLPLSSVRTDDEGALIEEYRGLLEDAVRLRLRSDVPVGLMLSGGLDSTAIAAFAARGGSRVRAFSGVTGDGYFDESDYIREAADYVGIESAVIRPEPSSLLETLSEMLAHHDEPVCTVTWYSLFLLTRRIARENIKVVLTGHGGDELLAGYWDHFHYHFFDLQRRGIAVTEEIAAWTSLHGRDPAELSRERRRIESAARDRSTEADRFLVNRDALAPAVRAVTRSRPPDVAHEDELTRRLALELLYETVPASLRAEDRNMMAHSMENRVPFLDYRLAEFCFSLPRAMKIRGGLGKWIHRKAMAGLLPERVLWRRDKTGHNAPLDLWLRTTLREAVGGMIEDDNPVNEEYYDRTAVRALFNRHQNGENHAMFFWQYLNLRRWRDQWLSIAPTPEESLK
jgi:asparagine synthase (glutamine-hydrolysing)